MAVNTKGGSASESLRADRTYGKVRCHNPSCMGRLEPAPDASQVSCPTCGMAYRLFWVRPDLPRIRGPVWDVNRKLASEMLARKLSQASEHELIKQEGSD
jgi:predicted RNA-binding Zn-ribbon protein involved in translation (DUF1610 family)